MNIVLFGDEKRRLELKNRLSELSNVHFSQSTADLVEADLVVDLNFDESPDNWPAYANLEDALVLVCSVKRSLAEILAEHDVEVLCQLVGLNALPSFLSRPSWELSLWKDTDQEEAAMILKTLGVTPLFVKDRVGMMMPRVLFMIMNEACYTLQEGTATIADIDLAMKLGTNYPHGPFEWMDKIGIEHVYETLLAIQEDTGDSRYKICSLLKQQYLNKELWKADSK